MAARSLAIECLPGSVTVALAVAGMAGGFCLTLMGALVAALLGLSPRAWGRRAVVGAAAAMLIWGMATALTATWDARILDAPAWLSLAAPLLGALGGLLGGLVEGVGAGADAAGRQKRRDE
jgi:hypothetical protein